MAAVNDAASAAATLDMLVCHGAGIFRYDATIRSSVICANNYAISFDFRCFAPLSRASLISHLHTSL